MKSAHNYKILDVAERLCGKLFFQTAMEVFRFCLLVGCSMFFSVMKTARILSAFKTLPFSMDKGKGREVSIFLSAFKTLPFYDRQTLCLSMLVDLNIHRDDKTI